MRGLTPRLYSISSSPDANPDEAHLTVAVVRYDAFGRQHWGSASNFLAADSTNVPVYVEPNDRFRLPNDTGTPIIMVGAGTGIAPYRAFVEHRREHGHAGKNWLFFGDRNFSSDFLYQLEWLRYRKEGLLTNLDVAFSRDQAEKVYVQHRLLNKGAEVYDWLESGANFYVCGDMTTLAPDVDRALHAIVREHGKLSDDKAKRIRGQPETGCTLSTRCILMSVKPSPVEEIKARSDYLRGTINAGLSDGATGALAEDDTQLSKFHGFYQQDDRDLRADRARQKLEPAHSFMIRVRVPGGIATPAQWLEMDRLAREYGNNTLRLTTRQAFQFHGVIKQDLKPTIAAINESLLDTIAACGDVNRNVMCTPLPEKSSIHKVAYEAAQAISTHLTPNTTAYHEIWLDKKRVAGSNDHEPIYGATYLPRKFKIGIAVPPSNDVDIFSQDLGFIAIANNGQLAGFNVTVGGGMGVDHGNPETYPRVADVIGLCQPEQAADVAEKVVTIQRDFGNRSNRKNARLKYNDRRSLARMVSKRAACAAGLRTCTAREVPVRFSRRRIRLVTRSGWRLAHDAVRATRSARRYERNSGAQCAGGNCQNPQRHVSFDRQIRTWSSVRSPKTRSLTSTAC